MNLWMKGELGRFVRDALLGPVARGRGLFNPDAIESQLDHQGTFSRGIWGALCVELWHRRFIDRSEPLRASAAPERAKTVN